MRIDDRRGEWVAGLGVGISLAGFLALMLLGRTHLSLATYAVAWLMLGGAGIWLLVWLRLHQMRLLSVERAELESLERERRERLAGAGSVFKEEDADQMEAFAAGRRLRSIERWLIPALAMATAALLAGAGARFLPGVWDWSFEIDVATSSLRAASMIAFFAGAIAFVAFALSRYTLGMSRVRSGTDWTPLRAGGAYYFGVSIACLALAIALVLAHNGFRGWERNLAVAIGVMMIALAIEIVANFVLDFYRPRVAGQAQRVFYESRVLGVFCEPEGIVRSLAHTVDYQFGFKVSETWFYELLGRAIVPLLVFQVLVVYVVTCLVVVPQGHQAVVEVTPPAGKGYRWIADPGVSVSWPWPFARATLIPVERVQRLELGYDRTKEKPVEKESLARWQQERLEVTLWTQKHRVKEYQLLVADRRASGDTKVPVNLLSVTMPVHWRVKPGKALEFYKHAHHIDPLIEGLAYRELTRYAACADLLELIGGGGITAAAELRSALQAACDKAAPGGSDLGVEIVYVGLGGVHPPTEVAEAYENVLIAYEQKDTKVRLAQAQAARIQIEAGGPRHEEVYEAIRAEDEAREKGAADLPQRSAKVEQLLRNAAGGDAREIAARSEEYLYRRVTLEGAGAELFRAQRAAHDAAPGVYRRRAYLDVLTEGLSKVQKYVVAVSRPERVIYQVDLKPPPPLQVLSEEMKSFQEGGGR